MQWFAIGLVLIVAALLALMFALFEPEFSRLRSEQMKAQEREGASTQESEQASTPIYDLIDKVLRTTGWRPYTEDQLAQAGIRSSVTQMVAITVLAAMIALLVGIAVSGMFLGILAAILAPFVVRVVVSVKTTKRREKFNRQMAEAMTLFSSALKAGMNVPNALANTAAEMEAPMGEELARIVNESRLGRDLVAAMKETAERMESSDFQWISEAVAIQRDSGGRLSEILDRVIDTIAERNELREKINTLSAEGKMSGYVLLALPVAVGGMYTLMNGDYMALLFTTFIGRILLVSALALYVVGFLWLRQITKVKL